ncbi:MAG: HNH endonuclease [Albidovulum sp.]|nr:HNH endonuclease [Albidovulum sp.]
MALYQVHDDYGSPMDACFETRKGELILHSRGGKIGSKNAQNTEYGPALRMLLKRVQQSNLKLEGVWVDSSHVSDLPMEKRKIFFPKNDKASPTELFTLLSRRMAKVGRDPNSQSRGNSNKRLRFAFTGNLPGKRIAQIAALGDISAVPVPPSPEDREWIEGNQKFVTHLSRERNRRIAKEKKKDFIAKNGKLLCERCELNPREIFGSELGDACIEVHHKVPVAEMLPGQTTKLEDLICVCANCHRVIHRELQNSKQEA